MEEYVVPLGVSAAVPFGGRHLSGLAVRMPGDLLLFDCGESTQFQLRAAGLKTGPLRAIFVTHLHGDHYYGLPGLLATLSLVGRTDRLTIVGPSALGKFLASIPVLEGRSRSFDVEFTALDASFTSGRIFNGDGYSVHAARLDHTIFAVGYRVELDATSGTLNVDLARSLGVVDPQQYGRLKRGESVVGMLGRVEASDVLGPRHRGASVAYVTDTRPCAGGIELARKADLLVHESTFLTSERSRAEETGHSTASQAAGVARDAEARRLLLTHFSARYQDAAVLEDEARTVFQRSSAAVELTKYSLQDGVSTLHSERTEQTQ